jgi:REP element-mobilizing transposase RayT
MTAPRQVLAGTTYLVTRRCAQREFLLRPSPVVNGLFQYLLAVVATRYNVLVHGFCVLSNHVHLLVTDVEARLPDFQRDLNALMARAMNVALGRSEGFWSSAGSYSAVTLLASRDILEKAVYVLANPVEAGLVRTGREWPGSWSAPEHIGAERFILDRPKGFFRENGPLPATAELRLTAPPGFESREAFREELVAALAAREQEIQAARAAEGRGFLGTRRILAQSPTARPVKKEEHGGLNPRVAGRDKWKRIEALHRLLAFRDAYRVALAKWRTRAVDALFPQGTYLMRVLHGVPCAAAA